MAASKNGIHRIHRGRGPKYRAINETIKMQFHKLTVRQVTIHTQQVLILRYLIL